MPLRRPAAPPDLRLTEPCLALRAAYLAMLRDFERHNEPFGQARASDIAADFEGYVALLRRYSRDDGGLVGSVPWTTYWLVRDGRTVLARASFRHRLTPALEREGGHIGYAVRPSERRRGYGTCLLALLLVEARARGFERVMVTCDADNIGSKRIIESNGGILASQGRSERSGKLVLCYWVAT